MKEKIDELPIMICECNSYEHQIHIWHEPESDEMYFEIHLTTRHDIFWRMWYAVKYVLGFKSRYGAWDEFLMKPEDRKKLLEFLKQTER